MFSNGLEPREFKGFEGGGVDGGEGEWYFSFFTK